MSLDLRLYMPTKESGACSNDCGHECLKDAETRVYDANITHNLVRMAAAAGIYEVLWYPEDLKITKAGDLIPFLTAGLDKLQADPAYFKQFDAPNGWGTYDHFVPFVAACLEACRENPEARVDVWR